MSAIAKRMFQVALQRSLLRGTLTYAGASYPCCHSPIVDTPVLSADGGGFSQQRLVTLVLDIDDCPAGTISVNKNASLLAADGQAYALRISGNDSAGSPYFLQFTAQHQHQGG